MPRLLLLEERVVPSPIARLGGHSGLNPVLPPRTGAGAQPFEVVQSTQVVPAVAQDAGPTNVGPLTGVPQTVTSGTGFNGVSLQDLFNQSGGIIPPDTMGAVGPTQFVEMINGQFAVYSKTGTLLKSESLDAFWSAVSPVNGTTDPHIFYDKHTGRWFASTIDINDAKTNNHILLAASKTSDATGAWNLYKVQGGNASEFADFDTLGVDDNGVYVGTNMFPKPGTTGNVHAAIFAARKAPFLTGAAITVKEFDNIQDMFAAPQPADNFDTVTATGPAWFVSTSTAVFGNVEYRTLTWSGSTPTLSTTKTLVTPAYGDPFSLPVPSKGSTLPIDAGDDRLLMAVIRDHNLWTARTVGVNNSGTASNVDRDAAEFLELNVTSTTASLIQSGREFDTAASNPRFYYYPSIMVNGQGYAAMGFTGSRATEFASVYATGRLAGDPLGKLQPVTLLKGGQGAYTITFGGARNRWGDYSYTSLDPTDDSTIWTIQEYAAAPIGTGGIEATSRWGTWINQLKAPASSNSTTTSLVSTANPSVYGEMVTFTANVHSNGKPGTPKGTVTFKEGTFVLGHASLANGRALFGTKILGVGNNTITAAYGGDGTFLASTGNNAASPQVVNKDDSHAAVSSSINPSVVGHAVTFTARIVAMPPGAGLPTGTVTFKDTFQGVTTTLGTGSLNATGRATFSTSTLLTGNHAITAIYGGDKRFNTSTSLAFGQAVHATSQASLVAGTVAPVAAETRAVLGNTLANSAYANASSAGVRQPVASDLALTHVDRFFSLVNIPVKSRFAGKITTDDWLSDPL
jgi:hypothetical protein